MRKIFLDMDGVLTKCTLGLMEAINHDLENDVQYTSRNRMKKLRKLKNYEGDDRVSLTIQFLDALLAKKDNKEEMTKWENLVKRYAFSPMTNNFEFWSNLSPTPEHVTLIAVCKELVGDDNVYILSAPVVDKGHCIKGKLDWLSRHTNFDDAHIFIREDKETIPSLFPEYACILIDDRKKNTDRFELTGGIGIVHTPKATSEGVVNTIIRLKELMKE